LNQNVAAARGPLGVYQSGSLHVVARSDAVADIEFVELRTEIGGGAGRQYEITVAIVLDVADATVSTTSSVIVH
jgi:hypothetical protein